MHKLVVFLAACLALVSGVHGAPTLKPTLKPTTKAPTTNPTFSTAARIYLYSNNIWDTTGYLGTRLETEWYCGNIAVTLNLFCQSHAAFVSYSAPDNLQNIATDLLATSATSVAVVGPTDIPIAANWQSLFSTPLVNTFTQAGVVSNPNELTNVFYTGSDNTGAWAGSTGSCSSWSDALSIDGCTVGTGDDTSSYLAYLQGACTGTAPSASTTAPQLICACYYDGR